MKTYVFDASALFAYLQKIAGASKVNELLKDAVRGSARVLMSAVNYGEVYGRILRDHGPDQAHTAMQVLSPLPIEVLDATLQRAFQAADVKAEFKLYYIDSFAAALAIEHKATLVTSDSDFRKLGHGFPVVWLKV
jgi:predicted nucleic acid-binding protein